MLLYGMFYGTQIKGKIDGLYSMSMPRFHPSIYTINSYTLR